MKNAPAVKHEAEEDWGRTTGGKSGGGRMLANVFSNTTPARAEKAKGAPLLDLVLSLCLMAAIAALAFLACAAL
jgi:hypothetical protein